MTGEAESSRAERRPRNRTTVRVETLGCRLNAAESETIRKLSGAAGLYDVTVVNTCAVTSEAARQARQRIRRLKRELPDGRIVVTGCAAQIDPDSFAQMPEIDAVLGNDEKLDLAHWRNLANPNPRGGDPKVRVNDIMAVRETAPQMIDAYGDRSRGFLQVQNGCDHRCTFCVIPYGRGPARSASVDMILEQAARLVDNGYRELVLTGVDITSWGADLDGAPPLGRLVGEILDRTPGLRRLRLSSVDGAEIDQELYERLVGDERLAPHLHLSVQAGDDMILKRMKRRHTRRDVIDLCGRLRAARDRFAFGADLIAGFPTETEDMFVNTLALIDDAGLNYLHVFPYSARAGTPAARMPQLPPATVKTRATRLRREGERARDAFLASLVGETASAIVEAGDRVRLDNYALVQLSTRSALRPGGEARVFISKFTDEGALRGELA